MRKTACRRKKGGDRIMTNVKRIGGDDGHYSVPRSGGKRFQGMGFILYTFVMGFLIFFAMTLRISCNDSAEKLNKEKARVKSRIHKLDLEIANLNLKRARLCSLANVNRKIYAYRLGLRPSEYSQVRKIVLRNSKGISDDSSVPAKDVKVSMR